MVTTSDGRSFAAADLPGLIEGASQGVGLGTQFLRHIERTRVILHVIDMSGMEGRDPYEDYLAINKELSTYNLRLLERPQIIVANKMDMPDAPENLVKFKEQLNKEKKMNLLMTSQYFQFLGDSTRIGRVIECYSRFVRSNARIPIVRRRTGRRNCTLWIQSRRS